MGIRVGKLLNDWTLFEKVWLVTFVGVIVATGVIFDDTWIGFVASISGVLCVVLVAKGKISNYYFGVVNLATYAYIAFQSQLYGEVMLNTLIYLPMQFIGFYMWKQNMDSGSVKAKRLSRRGWIDLGVLVIVTGILYGIFLNAIGSSQAKVDAFAVVLSITANFLMLKRYAEQWILWIIVNVLTITLWLNVFITDGNSVTILVMWIAFLVNSVYGYIKWIKRAEEVL